MPWSHSKAQMFSNEENSRGWGSCLFVCLFWGVVVVLPQNSVFFLCMGFQQQGGGVKWRKSSYPAILSSIPVSLDSFVIVNCQETVNLALVKISESQDSDLMAAKTPVSLFKCVKQRNRRRDNSQWKPEHRLGRTGSPGAWKGYTRSSPFCSCSHY